MAEKERMYEVDEAISYGLINKSVVEMVDKFSIKNKINKSSFVDGVIDPGIKSIDSVLSKMYRKTKLELNKNFSLNDVKDIIRCSIIIDNYDQVIPLVRELRKSIPNLKGDISENDTGYIGIHLSFVIDGFNAEMQISTRESWYAKQAGQEIYGRWRDFNLPNEIEKINNIMDIDEKQLKTQQLFSQYTLKTIQSTYCRNMFSSLHKYTKLDKLKEAINAVLCLNNHVNDCSDNFKPFTVKTEKEFIDNYKKNLSLAEKVKKQLIEYAHSALQIVRSTDIKDSTNLLTQSEKNYVVLKKKYFSMICEKMKKTFDGNFKVSKYIRNLNKISNKLTINSINKLNTYDLVELTLKDYKEDIDNLEKIVSRDITYENYFYNLTNKN